MAMESRAVGQARIDLPLDRLAEICRRYGVRRRGAPPENAAAVGE